MPRVGSEGGMALGIGGSVKPRLVAGSVDLFALLLTNPTVATPCSNCSVC